LTWEAANSALISNSLFFNSFGSEFGNISFSDGKWNLFVRDTGTGKLLRKSELIGWRFGSVENIGWMPDDKRILLYGTVRWRRPRCLVDCAGFAPQGSGRRRDRLCFSGTDLGEV